MDMQGVTRMRNSLLVDVRNAIRHRFTSVGGYPVYIYMADGEMICSSCARENYRQISRDTRNQPRSPWAAVAVDVYWEGPVEHCCQCNCELESAYGDPDEE